MQEKKVLPHQALNYDLRIEVCVTAYRSLRAVVFDSARKFRSAT
jgi:hypothetical protein